MNEDAHLVDEVALLDQELVALLDRRAQVARLLLGKSWDTTQESLLFRPEIDERDHDSHRNITPEIAASILDCIGSHFRSFLPRSSGIACLGPAATFSHIAATKIFGESARYLLLDSIREVVESLAYRKSDYAIVAIENSASGYVFSTLSKLRAAIDSGVRVKDELVLQQQHCLASASKAEDIRCIYSHHAAFDLCGAHLRKFESEVGREIKKVPTESTSVAARKACENPGSAAITNIFAAATWDLPVLDHSFTDSKSSCTRFLVLGNDEHHGVRGKKNKTSMFLSADHAAGNLVDALQPFKEHNVNMLGLESMRAARLHVREIAFFIELEGHLEDSNVALAIQSMRKLPHCRVDILGTYTAHPMPIPTDVVE